MTDLQQQYDKHLLDHKYEKYYHRLSNDKMIVKNVPSLLYFNVGIRISYSVDDRHYASFHKCYVNEVTNNDNN